MKKGILSDLQYFSTQEKQILMPFIFFSLNNHLSRRRKYFLHYNFQNIAFVFSTELELEFGGFFGSWIHQNKRGFYDYIFYSLWDFWRGPMVINN